MRSDADKCHLLVSTNDRVSLNEDGFKIDKSDTKKLLGVKFDKKVTSDDHISEICKKAGRKISALARVTPYTGTTKKRMIMNAFFTSQFGYCLLCNTFKTKIKKWKPENCPCRLCKFTLIE